MATKTKKDDDIKKILLTQEGLQKLIDELEELKGNGRRRVAERLKEAISYGDLSENAEYDEAKNQQAFLEARINELDDQIKSAEVVTNNKKTDEVQIGSTVLLHRFVDSFEHEYMVVGDTESDIIAGKISAYSPVGAAILGKKKGDKVTVAAPGGEYEYQLKKVS